MSIFDETFDVQSYIQKRLLEIEDLNSRHIYKELVGKIFLDLHDEIEQEYKSLEQRVLNEVSLPREGPEIITTIVDRTLYDVTDQSLRPMQPGDLQPLYVDSQALLDSMQETQPFFLYTVFLQADYLEVCKFNNPGRIFRGCIQTKHGEFTARFFVRPNTKYRRQMEELYEIFQINYLPWRPICAPYLQKLFDVYITDIENWSADQTILEARIDFEEYESFIRREQVPLWNISPITIKTSLYPQALDNPAGFYPDPCLDIIHYEHRLFKNRFQPTAQYLVVNRDITIKNLRWNSGDLLITCPVNQPVIWELYQCNAVVKASYPQPLMRNGSDPNFADTLRKHYAVPIKTKQEIVRILLAFPYTDVLKFINLRLTATPALKETYNLHSFITDEVRTEPGARALELDFEPHDYDFYLNRDIMSFLVSIIQCYFPEYECCGRLV